MITVNKKIIGKNSDEKSIYSKKRKAKKWLTLLLVLVFIATVALAVYFFLSWRSAQEKIKALTTAEGQQKMIAEETQDLVAKLSRHIVLPTGETPTIATITDIDALKKEQPFYEGASNGDKILIYKNAKKGFIYDPVRDLIVNVGPVYFEADNSATTNTPSSTNK